MSGVSIDVSVIHIMIDEGKSIQQIHSETGLAICFLTKNFGSFYENRKDLPMSGHKDEPYYKTEEEMLKTPAYTYESLSDSEKAIYDELAGDN